MKARVLPVPGVVFGSYPERRGAAARARQASLLAPRWHPWRRRALGPYIEIVAQARKSRREIDALDVDAFDARLMVLRGQLARHGLRPDLLGVALACVDRLSAATLGLRAFDTQLIAALVMLDGKLAEMATGEGKTLTAAFAAAVAAMAGVPVHVITANDYLVMRDAQRLQPLYRALGLRVGCVTQALDPDARRDAYACHITYCTAKELAFDYLRDGIALGHKRDDLRMRMRQLLRGGGQAEPLLRGLCMAIVDEADSILIDEARMPLILAQAQTNPEQQAHFGHALKIAAVLVEGRDYRLDAQRMVADLTAGSRALLERTTQALGGLWRNRLHREETICTALAALRLYQRERHYLVQDGKVVIIDETTGRLAPGRIWSRGLHRLIELKEGCTPTDAQSTTAQITFQGFFRRYHRLGGMSGTLTESRAELRQVFGLEVVKVPLRRPARRTLYATRLFPNRATQFDAVVQRVREAVTLRLPVLVGTDSVAESNALSQRLRAAGVPHAVLNASQDAHEAHIVERAGQAGQVTVATNMAGRGTDIALGPGVAERGGLHLICCQHNVSARIDRQLIGRCARQGDPGSAESFLALDGERIAPFVPAWLCRRVPNTGMRRPAWLVNLLVAFPQWRSERAQRAQRWAMFKQDERNEQRAGIAGAVE